MAKKGQRTPLGAGEVLSCVHELRAWAHFNGLSDLELWSVVSCATEQLERQLSPEERVQFTNRLKHEFDRHGWLN